MSVILDALHKARQEHEEGSYSTSRAVDVARPSYSLVKSQRSTLRAFLLFSVGSLGVVVALLTVGLGWWWFGMGGRNSAITEMVWPGRFVQSIPAVPVVPTPSSAALVPVDLPPPVPLSSLPAQAKSGGSEPAAAALPGSAGSAAAVATLIPQEKSQAATTSGVAAGEPAPFAFRLGTILCDGTDCSASLNGRTVRAGDTVREHKVISVTATEVTLQRADEPVIVLSLLQ